MSIKRIVIIGGGIMGSGIASVLTYFGYKVSILEKNDKNLKKSKRLVNENVIRLGKRYKKDINEINREISTNIHYTTNFNVVSEADLIIEAVTEDYKIKSQVYSKISNLIGSETIVTSNTSSLSIARLSEKLENKENFLGLHFFNPVPYMDLVEVTPTMSTSEKIVYEVEKFAYSIQKHPIVLKKEIPGFIVNRILIPSTILGVFDLSHWEKEDIDLTMREVYNFPMGPIELADFIGLDTLYNINKNLGILPNPPVLPEKIKKRELGKKTGKGFYTWSNNKPNLKRGIKLHYPGIRIIATILNQKMKLIEEDIAEESEIDIALKLGANLPVELLKLYQSEHRDKIINTLDELNSEFKIGNMFKPSRMWLETMNKITKKITKEEV